MKQLSLYAAGPVMLAGMAWFLAQEKSPDLTQLHVPEVPWEQPKDPRVIGVQAVTLTDIALERLATGGGEVVLPLPSGERLTVHLEAGELTTTGGRVHRGMVENNPDSIVLLVEEEGLLAGSVDLADGRFFTLLHAGMGRYRLETVDLARAPICEEDTDDQGAPELTEEGGIMAEDKVRMLTVRRPPIRPETAVNGLGKYIRINLRIHPRRTITQPVKKPLFKPDKIDLARFEISEVEKRREQIKKYGGLLKDGKIVPPDDSDKSLATPSYKTGALNADFDMNSTMGIFDQKMSHEIIK